MPPIIDHHKSLYDTRKSKYVQLQHNILNPWNNINSSHYSNHPIILFCNALVALSFSFFTAQEEHNLQHLIIDCFVILSIEPDYPQFLSAARDQCKYNRVVVFWALQWPCPFDVDKTVAVGDLFVSLWAPVVAYLSWTRVQSINYASRPTHKPPAFRMSCWLGK